MDMIKKYKKILLWVLFPVVIGGGYYSYRLATCTGSQCASQQQVSAQASPEALSLSNKGIQRIKKASILDAQEQVSIKLASKKRVSKDIVLKKDVNKSNRIEWIAIGDLEEAQRRESRKVFIDLYTDWCGWCKVMDKNTFANAEVVDYTNEKYYAVKFNAEQVEDVNFKGVTFKFKKTSRGGYHELASELTRGKLSYPTTVFLDQNLSILTVLQGYQKPDFFVKVLGYFAEDHYKSTSWEQYNAIN